MSVTSVSSRTSDSSKKDGKRLSQRLHLHRTPAESENVPRSLPEIITTGDGQDDNDGAETQWEARATILATSRPSSAAGSRPRSRSLSNAAIDADIQEAIRLHEEGDLERSTRLFGRLADPNGPNNPLSQVLYGLALR
jgi:hypothetical protein